MPSSQTLVHTRYPTLTTLLIHIITTRVRYHCAGLPITHLTPKSDQCTRQRQPRNRRRGPRPRPIIRQRTRQPSGGDQCWPGDEAGKDGPAPPRMVAPYGAVDDGRDAEDATRLGEERRGGDVEEEAAEEGLEGCEWHGVGGGGRARSKEEGEASVGSR